MTEITIYHNPRCSKSRQTLALVRESGVEPVIVDYLNNPPDRNTLETLLHRLNIGPRDLIRKSEAEFETLGLNNPALTDPELIDALLQHPRLMERPIVTKGDRAVLGRPPENVRSLL